mmetsp:Transcript_1093/g.1119  ORF Transcript_1093/g.1119 Transcript_1093/m.1119 type:complete len:83 (-) Transcript_1093:519-767(-)
MRKRSLCRLSTGNLGRVVLYASLLDGTSRFKFWYPNWRVFQCGGVELLFGTRSPDRKKCALVQHPHLLLLLRSKRMGLGGTA